MQNLIKCLDDLKNNKFPNLNDNFVSIVISEFSFLNIHENYNEIAQVLELVCDCSLLIELFTISLINNYELVKKKFFYYYNIITGFENLKHFILNTKLKEKQIEYELQQLLNFIDYSKLNLIMKELNNYSNKEIEVIEIKE